MIWDALYENNKLIGWTEIENEDPPPLQKQKMRFFATEIRRIKFRWRITKCRGVTITVSIHKTRRCDFKYRYRDNENILRVSRCIYKTIIILINQ